MGCSVTLLLILEVVPASKPSKLTSTLGTSLARASQSVDVMSLSTLPRLPSQTSTLYLNTVRLISFRLAHALIRMLDGLGEEDPMEIVLNAQVVYLPVLKENVKHYMENTALRVQLVQGLFHHQVFVQAMVQIK